jgi:hypothetical protein
MFLATKKKSKTNDDEIKTNITFLSTLFLFIC